MAPALLPPFELSITSGELAVREALGRFIAALSPISLEVEETGTVELVMAEVLNNIVEHAYPDATKPGPIDIRCAHKADGLHVSITDAGLAMPDGKLPLGEPVSVDVALDDLPEGGFGWFLIQDLAKDVHYARNSHQNRLTMRLPVGMTG
ncbi:ATP-binding protein [uncultured Roseobacter sp.]|uniref:ATP-binding protein n=1 Tax=uncultured Roseobacter sp. TaxID=114847 RepID=UPI00261094E5|nr:ATP-binding protein [uncultured Roseobacter sp.]